DRQPANRCDELRVIERRIECARRTDLLGQLSRRNPPHRWRIGFATTEPAAERTCAIADEQEFWITQSVYDRDRNGVALCLARGDRGLGSLNSQGSGKDLEGFGRQGLGWYRDSAGEKHDAGDWHARAGADHGIPPDVRCCCYG